MKAVIDYKELDIRVTSLIYPDRFQSLDTYEFIQKKLAFLLILFYTFE